ncbi:hypothetical protein [Aquamicrobium sp. LC103]|uniref:hypothetical protein n=1 Tax=Aquamicrobium sp. LC103 TaxID=1120658 RepID=UPI00063EC84D|nr:hypothetical protein [Aquamicrobium sp. LC103]TKT78435.1 hypothetical protein XW59_012530 [Aquamicrobium sp. LC103]
MANRVVLGSRGATTGLYISKPGFNALTAAIGSMLLSTDEPPFQVLQRGILGLASGGNLVSHPSLGYKPYTMVFPTDERWLTDTTEPYIRFWITHPSLTSVRITTDSGWPAGWQIGYAITTLALT